MMMRIITNNIRNKKSFYGCIALALLFIFLHPLSDWFIKHKDTADTPVNKTTYNNYLPKTTSTHTGPEEIFITHPTLYGTPPDKESDKADDSDSEIGYAGAYMEMPIPELLDEIISDDAISDAWAIAALVFRYDEAAPFVKTVLHSGTAWEQYSLTRKLAYANPEQYKNDLLALATNSNTHYLAHTGACYALANVELDHKAQKALLQNAENGTPLHQRTTLIALSGSNCTVIQPQLETFLQSDDPLTSIYASRILLKHGSSVPPETLFAFTRHTDYLVRSEAYGALGLCDSPNIKAFLENAVNTETNQSAARSAVLALLLQQGRGRNGELDQKHIARELVNSMDDTLCWMGFDYAMKYDMALAENITKALAVFESSLNDPCAALLAIHKNKSFEDNDLYTQERDRSQESLEYDEKHAITIHEGMAHYNVALHNAQGTLPKINGATELLLAGNVVLEDLGAKPLNHAYNPLTGRGFLWKDGYGGSAKNYVSKLLAELDSLCSKTILSEDDMITAWQLAGSVFHVLQDMTSPLHVFTVWHVLNGCHYEFYWLPLSEQALQIVNASNAQPISLPTLPDYAAIYLDAHTKNALEQRIANLPNTLEAYQDALAWCTYYRASFWGEVNYADKASEAETHPADFEDGSVGTLPNILANMFEGNIRWHTSWWGDYFEITDRLGNTFQWNRLFSLDDWKPCPNPPNQKKMDGHIRLHAADDMLTITGRFFFTHKGKRTPYCHPFTHPDGTVMTEHLVQYYGETLFPVTASYNGGWLALLSERYPQMFDMDYLPNIKANKAFDGTENNYKSLIHRLLAEAGFEIKEESKRGGRVRDYLNIYIPHCGCRPLQD